MNLLQAESEGRSWRGTVFVAGLSLALVAGTAVYALEPGLIERASVLAGSGNPFASPIVAAREAFVYPVSPLQVWLELEAAERPVDVDGVMAFGDDLAKDVGYWLLAATGAREVGAAERVLWSEGKNPDGLVTAFALALQDRRVYIRNDHRLSSGIPVEGFRYAARDELLPLFLHVAWHLDLDVRVVRSPIHHYAVWHAPDGSRTRGVEPTAFWRVDTLGKRVHNDEPSVGRRLVFPEAHFPSGVGGINNPNPLPAGAYTEVLPGELDSAWAAQLSAPELRLKAEQSGQTRR